MVELFEYGDQEGEGLAATGFGRGEEIVALECGRDGACLDVGEGLKMGGS